MGPDEQHALSKGKGTTHYGSLKLGEEYNAQRPG